MKLERRNEGNGMAGRDQQGVSEQRGRGTRKPADDDMRLDSRDDDQYRGKSDGEMLARYEF